MTPDAPLAVVSDSAPTSTLPSPIFRGAQMVKALADYRELQAALDKAMPDQIMQIGDRAFRKKGYWRAIAVAFHLTVECEREQRNVFGTLADGTDNYVYTVVYRASAPNGRATVGDGACGASEKQKGRMDATDHNVRSHACTRAYNRAVSNLVGFGEVSAEEVERDEHTSATAPETLRRADGATQVVRVDETAGQKKDGTPWTRYAVTFTDGRGASTFDAGLATRAREAIRTAAWVLPTIESSGQHKNLKVLAPMPDEPGQEETAASTISEHEAKKLWAIAKAHAWSEMQVRALFDEQQIESTAAIPVAIYPTLIQRLKEGPPSAPPPPERAA